MGWCTKWLRERATTVSGCPLLRHHSRRHPLPVVRMRPGCSVPLELRERSLFISGMAPAVPTSLSRATNCAPSWCHSCQRAPPHPTPSVSRGRGPLVNTVRWRSRNCLPMRFGWVVASRGSRRTSGEVGLLSPHSFVDFFAGGADRKFLRITTRCPLLATECAHRFTGHRGLDNFVFWHIVGKELVIARVEGLFIEEFLKLTVENRCSATGAVAIFLLLPHNLTHTDEFTCRGPVGEVRRRESLVRGGRKFSHRQRRRSRGLSRRTRYRRPARREANPHRGLSQ